MKDKYVYDEVTGNFKQEEQVSTVTPNDKNKDSSSSKINRSKIIEGGIYFVCGFIALVVLGSFLWSCSTEVLLLVSAIVSLIVTISVIVFEL